MPTPAEPSSSLNPLAPLSLSADRPSETVEHQKKGARRTPRGSSSAAFSAAPPDPDNVDNTETACEVEELGSSRNSSLAAAKSAKNDEFYTQWTDIEREMNAYLEYDPDVFRGKVILLPCDDPEWSNFSKFFALHFVEFGIKKMISTSYAPNSKPSTINYEPTLFESQAPQFDPIKTRSLGKKFVLEAKDINGGSVLNIEDLQWEYLEGDGDFRSDEVTALRDEADLVITNPPFSLFREFLAWLMAGKVGFAVIGNINAITYKEVFPLIKEDKLWLGKGFKNGADFRVPGVDLDQEGEAKPKVVHLGNVTWFTNLEHGRRHEPMTLMTKAENKKHSTHKNVRDVGYKKYDNYDAIEVPYVDAIPSDYAGVMGVPISFLDKYNPDQFEILGATQRGCHDQVPDTKKYDTYKEMRPDGTPTGSSGGKTNENANLVGNDGKKNYFINARGHVVQSAYQRLFIRHRKAAQ
jgi:hypothetical protein